LWSGGSSRSRAMGRRFLRPVARYRSRCVRPSSTFAGCHGAGVDARGPTYVAAQASSAVAVLSTTELLSPNDPVDPRVIEADDLADVAKRESILLRLGECLAPRFSGGFAVALELLLSSLDGAAGSFALWVVGHWRSLVCGSENLARIDAPRSYASALSTSMALELAQ